MYRLSGNSPKVLNAKKKKTTGKKKKRKKEKKTFVARIKVILIALLSGKCNNAWEFCTLSP